MARTNMTARRLKPEAPELLMLRVVRREQLSPHFVRVTFGGEELQRFAYLGFDQWFRLFIPVSDGSLEQLPKSKLTTRSYLKYLRISKDDRPILRAYTVRAYRAEGTDGPEIDVDFVVHGSESDGTAGPAATWARSCSAGDRLAIIDEGAMFNPPDGRRLLLVTDESGLAAAAGVLGSLPEDAVGQALLEIPSEEDKLDLRAPTGVEVNWVVRNGAGGTPGRLALTEAAKIEVSDQCYGWVVGEQALAAGMRRHWVGAGMHKNDVMFCGYWRVGQSAGS